MSAERDQGLNALQSGNAAEAVTLLESATQADPTDYQAFMYLGAAYGQVERHNDAISALTQAVTLQPSNAQARYNLGIAMERGGFAEQALTAYQQAVQLQPDYPKAQEAARRLETPAAPNSLDAAAEPGYAAPTGAEPTQYAPQGYAPQPPMQSQYPPSQPTYPVAPQGGYAPPPGQPIPGYNPPMLPGQPVSPYGQPGAYPGTYAPDAYRGGTAAYVEDKFDLKQAALDWVQIITSPNAFFQGQAGRSGYKAPLAFVFFTLLVQSLARLLGSLLKPATLGAAVLNFGLNLTLVFAFSALFLLIGAAILHGAGKLFGNQSDLSGSFRVIAYMSAPALILSVILGLATPLLAPNTASPLGLQKSGRRLEAMDARLHQSQNRPGSPGGSYRYTPNGGSYQPGSATGAPANPFSNPALGGIMALGVFGVLLGLGVFVWELILMVIGVSQVHQVSTGSAIGTMLVCLLICVVIFVGLAVLLGGALIAAMAGSH